MPNGVKVNDLEKYNEVRGFIYTGDNISFSMNSIFGWGIKQVTKSELTHTATVIRFQEIPNRVFLLEAMRNGIEINLLSERLRYADGKAYWYPLREEWNPVRPSILRASLLSGLAFNPATGRKKGYDLLDCLKNLFGRVNKCAKAYFCSEHWYMTLEEAAIWHFYETRDDRPLTMIKMANAYLENKSPVPGDINFLGLTDKRIQLI